MLPDNVTELIHPYVFRVRPRHLETFASFEARVTSENLENRSHKVALLGQLRPLTPRHHPADLWKDIVLARAAVDASRFEDRDAPELTHPDGSRCNGCEVGIREQWMCRLCAHGQEVRQRPHLEKLVCQRHRLWVGSGTATADQFVVTDEYIAAERAFQILRRKGVANAATLWELIHIVDPTLTDTAQHHLMPHQPFPAAVQLWTILAEVGAQEQLFNPGNTYAEAFAFLNRALAGFDDAGLVRRVWHYLRPTALTVREWAKEGGTFRPHWEHDFPLNPASMRNWEPPTLPLEPFARYLAASGVTEITEANWREVLTHRNPGQTMKFFRDREARPAICVNGHRVTMEVVKAFGRHTTYKCGYCSGSFAVAGENDFTVTHPARAAWFDAEADASIDPRRYVWTSARRLPFKCPKGHRYVRAIKAQCTAPEPCMVCSNRDLHGETNSFAALAPTLIGEWHPALNDRSPWEVKVSDSEYAWFLCPQGHKPYRTLTVKRVQGSGCAPCAREALARKRSEKAMLQRTDLIAEWNPTLNGGLPFADLRKQDKTLRTWVCSRGHTYRKTVRSRIARGCPRCPNADGYQTALATERYPLILSEFDAAENEIPADLITSKGSYYWRCTAAGHLEKAGLHKRRQSRGCIRCAPTNRIAAGLEKGTY
ncbi:zinc-ribbon domain-containing protein [Leifsonia xyli]|uniref:zinc-ribbon domain-containing protein n=1 Tax=Leifsonia xyli TaxID=1575 RepID=UPI003D67EBA6